jgi:diguanylate cyclase (GGDEF)-like protein/PAS domain S-box-containing protein
MSAFPPPAPAAPAAPELGPDAASGAPEAHASALHLRALVGASADAIVSADAHGRIVLWNRAAERIFGYTEAEALGRSLTMLMPPRHRAGHSAGLARVAGGAPPRLAGQVVSIEALRKSGEVFPIDLATTSYAVGGEVWFTSIIRDTTDRTRAERALREQHALFAAVLAGTTDAMWVKDAAGTYQLINDAGARMLAREAADVVGRVDADLFAPESARAARARDLAVVESGVPCTEEIESTSADGTRRAYLTTRAPLRDADGRVTGVLGVSRDVTERRRHEAARAREARLGLLTTQLPAVLWSVDAELRFTFSSGAALAALGLTTDQLVGLPLTDYLGTSDPDAPALVAVREALGGRSAEYAFRLAGRTYQTHVEPLRDAGGAIAGVLGLSVDVTERCRLEAELAHQAFHDALTGLANRALFRDRVGHALARRPAPGAGRVAVLVLDLDDFKAVNDSLGHPQGDALLREVAARLLRATRGSDTVARLGGDEFAVLLEDVAAADGAAPAVARIEAALRAPVRLGGGDAARPWRVRASVGVAYAAPGDSGDDLLRNADLALYAAKADGKDRHAVFDPAMHAAVVARLELEADLRRAVGELERAPERASGGGPDAPCPGLRLVYQPVVDVADGRVVAVEALARWTRPDGTAVAPAAFIPVAEATGVVVPLGRWVLRAACAEVAAWRARGGPAAGVRLTVNVSGRQLADCDALARDVAAALAESGLPANALTLEMTESVLMQRTDETLERLAALKALGVRLAIDDFGTGYSSLAYLQRFPVDVLKLDKAFVDGVADEEGDRAIARTVIALGRALGLETVAEGIEREAQRAALAALGCAYAQGYLFARPLEAAAAAAYVGAPAAARSARAGAAG